MLSERRFIDIYVRLLDEGTECFRATRGRPLEDGRFELLPTQDYDPADELWEFHPGAVVRAAIKEWGGKSYLLAVRP